MCFLDERNTTSHDVDYQYTVVDALQTNSAIKNSEIFSPQRWCESWFFCLRISWCAEWIIHALYCWSHSLASVSFPPSAGNLKTHAHNQKKTAPHPLQQRSRAAAAPQEEESRTPSTTTTTTISTTCPDLLLSSRCSPKTWYPRW